MLISNEDYLHCAALTYDKSLLWLVLMLMMKQLCNFPVMF